MKMVNKIYLITVILLMYKGGLIVYEENKKGGSKSKKLVRVGHIMMGLSVIMIVIYLIFFTTDGIYGQLP